MALSSLITIGSAAPGAGSYTAFNPPVPGRLTQGELEGQVSFGLLGYSNQDQNVVVFSVTASADTVAKIQINSDGSALSIQDESGSNSEAVTNYYSVNLGMNSVSGGAWTLTFNAETKDKKSGTWVFVKSSGEPPHR